MKILITGGSGMVGTTFTKKNDQNDYILINSKQYDLTSYADADKLIKNVKPDAVIHLAAKVGGVKGNSQFIADFFQENVLINTNILTACVKNKVENVVSMLSTCIYPDKASYPLTPNQIHLGEPHESNFGYAYAKRMLEVHSRAIYKQYGLLYKTAVPNNIYGPNDNFHYEYSHVIPAMIRKIYEGEKEGKKVLLWGDGSPLREFTYSENISDILIWMLNNYSGISPLNIGNTSEYSISDVAKLICKHLNFDYNNIIWDTSKPMGQYKKPSSSKELFDLGCKVNYTSLDDGLKNTCEWFIKNYPNVRGVDK